jgi:hypothetical protein
MLPMIIFGDFSQFSAIKLAFFFKTNVLIHFCITFGQKRHIFLQKILAKMFLKYICLYLKRFNLSDEILG